LFSVVSNSIRPCAGELIAFFCVLVILGGRKPLVVDSILTNADVSSVNVPNELKFVLPLTNVF
jgi:hypothetical protein